MSVSNLIQLKNIFISTLILVNGCLVGVLSGKTLQKNQQPSNEISQSSKTDTVDENYTLTVPEDFSIEYLDGIQEDKEQVHYENNFNICLLIFIMLGILFLLQTLNFQFKLLDKSLIFVNVVVFIGLLCCYTYVSKNLKLQLLNYLFYSVISVILLIYLFDVLGRYTKIFETIKIKFSNIFQNFGKSAEILVELLQNVNFNLGKVGDDLNYTTGSLKYLVDTDLENILNTVKKKIQNLSYKGWLGHLS